MDVNKGSGSGLVHVSVALFLFLCPFALLRAAAVRIIHIFRPFTFSFSPKSWWE